MIDNYKDIIDLPYPRNDWNFLMKHPRMSVANRAKIFSFRHPERSEGSSHFLVLQNITGLTLCVRGFGSENIEKRMKQSNLFDYF